MPYLAPKDREIYCDKILDQSPNQTPGLFGDAPDHIWSPEFSERQIASAAREDGLISQREHLLYHANSSTLPALTKLIPGNAPEATERREDLSAGLREREAIRKAFAAPS